MEKPKRLPCPICMKKAKLKTDSKGNVKIYCPYCKKQEKKIKRMFAVAMNGRKKNNEE